ncbi:MAG: hypothetical protein MUF13_16345, partial [Akkermansiaceae bacterium]|nr:hypothetical protein [Akkermansiaceae bacterium]
MKKTHLLKILAVLYIGTASAAPYKGVEVSTDEDKVVYYDSKILKIVSVNVTDNKILKIDVPERVFSCYAFSDTIVAITHDGFFHLYVKNIFNKTIKVENT